jgi:CubicO group peptidase (beta-lactamase class C family)
LLKVFFAAVLAITALDDRIPTREPADVGMSADRLATVDRIVRKGISGGAFPGASVVIGHAGFVVLHRGYGRLEWSSTSPVVTPDETIYDLASLTKVVGTTTAAMILYDEGKLPLDAPVKQFIPEFTGGGRDRITIRLLLTHHSGLPAGRILWHRANSPAEAKKLILTTPLGCPPGECFTYSDLGADVLGWVIEKVSGQSLDRFLAARVFEPLQMNDTYYRPAKSLVKRIAPTQEESRRGYALRGEVNDESAYLLGGVAGNAGLFSTASDLAVFAQMMLNRGEINGTRLVADSTVRLFTTEVADSRALGWETVKHIHGAGDLMGSHAYGHTGYTGTSIWIDPDRRLFVVILSNRTYASHSRRSADAIADVRNDIADAASLSITSDVRMSALAMPNAFRSDTAQTWNRVTRPAWRIAAERRKGTPVGLFVSAAPTTPAPAKSASMTQKTSPSTNATKAAPASPSTPPPAHTTVSPSAQKPPPVY